TRTSASAIRLYTAPFVNPSCKREKATLKSIGSCLIYGIATCLLGDHPASVIDHHHQCSVTIHPVVIRRGHVVDALGTDNALCRLDGVTQCGPELGRPGRGGLQCHG